MNNITEKKISGIVVFRKGDSEDIDSLVKRFKKKVNSSGILRELKFKSFYEKPSVLKKRKRKEAQIRREKEEQKIMSRKRGFGNKYEKNSGDK